MHEFSHFDLLKFVGKSEPTRFLPNGDLVVMNFKIFAPQPKSIKIPLTQDESQQVKPVSFGVNKT